MAEGKLTIGNVEVLGFSDGRGDFPRTLDDLFPEVTAEQWEPHQQRYPSLFSGPNVWHLDFCCYLLRSQGRTILVDSGMGPAGAPMAIYMGIPGCLLEKLQAEGVRPEDVDTVIPTHLHWDHIGWNVVEEGGRRRLTFPRARYLVHRADWEAFQRPEARTWFPLPYVDELITPLETLGGLELIDGDRNVTAEVTILHTPGHTPGSVSILIVSAGQRAIVWGDVIVHPAQVTEPDWLFAYDLDIGLARQTRRQLVDRIEAEGMTVLACHFPEPGVGRLVRLEGRRYWQAL
jgi:glyoxylase-like metal-dependent hydrolase (beta-lactamase superfamily II)